MKMMNVVERIKAPTPPFFKVLRMIGLSVAAGGSALLASPVELPSGVVTLAVHLITSGMVMSAVSQTAMENSIRKRKGGSRVRTS